MELEQYRINGKSLIDYICKYYETLGARKPAPNVKPGFMRPLISDTAPEKGEDFDKIMKDFEKIVLPGLAHWNHPQFYAYYPNGISYAAALAEMLGTALGVLTFSWVSSPAGTELEMNSLMWLGRALELPEIYNFDKKDSKAGAAMLPTSSEATFLTMIAARHRMLEKMKTSAAKNDDAIEDYSHLGKFVVYCSQDAHSCVEKAAKMSLTRFHSIKPENGGIRGSALEKAITEDKDKGLIPIFVVATLGTTNECGFDALEEIGKVCQKYPDIWLHVDSAYAGTSFIVPEMNNYKKGLEYSDSIVLNPYKLMGLVCGGSCLFLKNSQEYQSGLIVNPLYLSYEHKFTVDFRNFGISLTRKFLGLKLWFLLKNHGLDGLRKHVRNVMSLAQHFKSHVLKDNRFEIVNDVIVGVICIRIKDGDDDLNQELVDRLNKTYEIHLVPARARDKFIVRLSISSATTEEKHVDVAWKVIQDTTTKLLAEKGKK